MTSTFNMNEDKMSVMLKIKSNCFHMAHLQYFHEKEKKSAN